jgi:hypothetical protein
VDDNLPDRDHPGFVRAVRLPRDTSLLGRQRGVPLHPALDHRMLEAEDLDAVFGDANNDGRRLFWISDIGPGDTFRLPLVAQLERK